ncbi:hypothetical protein OTK49_01555 [Vibrio coralliirubri]|uniref:hypothetical protein n=1 Tax=Vibrio coralliirubri TaxID=1516159 RepID=UPI002284B63B|nr:hypothetical protein [Vibrio coralliirubri]MCY9861211.1 hypothetical protein [Vibrio coralliirubri]
MQIAKEILLLMWQSYQKQPHKVSAHCLVWLMTLVVCWALNQLNLGGVYVYVLIPSMALLSLVYFSHVFLNPESNIVAAASAIPVTHLSVRLGVLALICISSSYISQSLPPNNSGESISIVPSLSLMIVIGFLNSVINLFAGVYCLSYMVSSTLMKPDYLFLKSYMIPLLMLASVFSAVFVLLYYLSDGLLLEVTTLLTSIISTLLLGSAYAHYKGHKPQSAEEKSSIGELNIGF